MMITFIHCADLHLDSPFKGLKGLPKSIFDRLQESTFASFSRLTDAAIEEKVDFMLIVGDVFDGDMRSLKAQFRFNKEMEKLNKYGITVFVSHGNHDHLGGQWTDLDWPENVIFFAGNNVQQVPFIKNGVTAALIHGFSYETKAVEENRTSQYPVKAGDVHHIGMLHGQAAGYTGHDPYAPFLLQELISKNYDYWALGHIHKRSELSLQPPVCYSGNIQGRHKNETGEKGAYVVTLNENGAESRFIPTCDIIWKEIILDMSTVDRESDLLNKCLIFKEEMREESRGVLLRVILTGKSSIFLSLSAFLLELHDVLNEEENGEDFVYVHEIINDCFPADADGNQSNTGFWSDVQQTLEDSSWIEETLGDLYHHRQAAKYLDRLPEEEMKELIKQAENELLQERFKS
ncbi:exonuclease SbcCD subunit D [Fictibacillus aquaticus]|nr:DNA repair exonuclease [Fictibacillus aquaticus]